MEYEMSEEVLVQAEKISDWLRENRNPHTTIEITDSGVKMVSDESYKPFEKK